MIPWRLALPLAVSLAITGAVLGSAASNRRGEPEATLTLTERELEMPYRDPTAGSDNTALSLSLHTQSPDGMYDGDSAKVFDLAKMRALGFRCDPSRESSPSTAAPEDCTHESNRRAHVAFEYDGPAWTAYRAALERRRLERESSGPERTSGMPASDTSDIRESHLVLVDADLSADALRARHPDRTRYLILAAEVGAMVATHRPTAPYTLIPLHERRLTGHIVRITPNAVNVPLPFRAFFDTLRDDERSGAPRYEVRLVVGQRLEPWIADVRPLK